MCDTLLKTPKFDVQRRVVTRRDGGRSDYQVVVHPGAVVILPLLDDDRVVMIRNYRVAVDSTLLELPAGTLEAGETPETCAARELEEETGYRAAKMERLCTFYTSPGILTERMYAFVARDLTHVGQNLDESEQIKVDVLSMDRIRQMLLGGDVVDGKTIATLGTYLLKQQG